MTASREVGWVGGIVDLKGGGGFFVGVKATVRQGRHGVGLLTKEPGTTFSLGEKEG